MKRIALTDGSNKWFNIHGAEGFGENSDWDGSNHISKATGSQTEHETLYRTAGGKWVLNHWSQWQGSRETYEELSDKEAAEWFVKNEYEDIEIPEDLWPLVKEDIYMLEI